jgi:hypothetical protein
MNGFEAFWILFPRRIGRLAAMKAYERALKLASADVILEGVERYKANKPEYADWCHPSTWLNQGRWMDEYETPPKKPQLTLVYTEWSCPHVERCSHRSMCESATILGRPERQAS